MRAIFASVGLAAVLFTIPATAESWFQRAPASQAEVQLSFAPVVKRAAPAVTNIYTRKRVERRFNDPLFAMLFGFSGGPRTQDDTSLGSGVIVSEDGLVLTNAHVIENADEITVALADRREFRAEVLLSDDRSDLAVLKIDAAELPYLALRDSDEVEVGDLVLAIGNPFGVGQTVTSGIVSAQTRTDGDGQVFIQTDAAINPGNSGGALVDMQGRLVGVNTMILSRSGGSNGIGFAIPSNLAALALEGARSGQTRLARAWIGADVEPVTADIASSIGLLRPEGVIVASLHPASPLTLAGLKSGDIVTAIEGVPIASTAELDYRLAAVPVGTDVAVDYLRGADARRTQITLVVPPEIPARDLTEIRGNNPFAGAVVANINPALAQEAGFEQSAEGVVVVGGRSGLRRGDRILEVNGERIGLVADLRRVTSFEYRRWEITVRRSGRILRLVAQS